jgi:type IV pilus assembly protein PilC
MPEYRYVGVNVSGKAIQGVIFSQDSRAARSKLDSIGKTKGIRIDAIQKKLTYLYKVQRGQEKPIFGEQKAFSREDVNAALLKMGYKIHYIRRKWFNLKFGIPTKDLVLFMRICADLLKEKFPYTEILTLVASDTSNKRLRETVKEIQKDLKSGNDGFAVYGKHVDVFGKFTAHMLAVASTSGNMAEIYESTAKFLEREAEFKSNLRTMLFMPIIVVLVMIAAVVFYITYVFPKITGIFTKFDIEIPPMTKATMQVSAFLQDYWFFMVAGTVVPIILFVAWAKSERGRYVIDRTLIRLPLVGSLFHRMSIEIFCRVFHSLYSTSGENIAAIRISAESSRNLFIQNQICNIVVPRMLKEGKSFVECLNRANCFTLTAIRRLKSGEESGTIRETALQLANYYEKETKHKMSTLMDSINIIISVLITALIIGLTLVSSEIGFVSPPSPLNR